MPKCNFKKLQGSFIETTLQYGCSPGNLLHVSEHLFTRTVEDCFCTEIEATQYISIIKVKYLHPCIQNLSEDDI